MPVTRPNLFLVGAPRTGTTAMHQYLAAHPQIFMSELKEPHYFGSDLLLRGPRYTVRGDESAYLALFADAGDARVVGESSPGYLFSDVAPAEILAFSPDARILVMLRSPADLLISLHHQSSRVGDENLPLAAALEAEDDRRSGRRIPRSCQAVHALRYREIGRLSHHLRRYLEVFGTERVHVVVYDDLRDDPADVYRSTLEFLSVDPHFRPEFRIVNASRGSTVLPRRLASALPPALRRRAERSVTAVKGSVMTRAPKDDQEIERIRRQLREEFAGEVAALGETIGRDLSHWTHG